MVGGQDGGPPPPLGPPWAGPGGADAALRPRVAEASAPQAAAHGSCPALRPSAGKRGPRAEAAETPNKGPGACAGRWGRRVGDPGT